MCRSPACSPPRLVMWSAASRRWSFAAGWA
uniref:Uncharacterized protein n=1 Tax=Siphoviridae sp. ct3CA7 TaxID=2823561 RepID=A0A8S5LFC1_9CAUD|nr:MAG TPA: hypothetical protein [Siphoviridae sp. ct3CA7]